MPAVKLEQFGGMLPAWDPHLLPTGQASYSRNGYLFSGALTGWRAPKVLRTLTNPNARKAYRIPTVAETQARAYLIFKAQPTNGDTVIVGDLSYTFKTILPPVAGSPGDFGSPGDVLIGATTDATASNFAAALTADSNQNTNSGTLYGSQTVANNDVFILQPNTTAPVGLVPPTQMDSTVGNTVYATTLVGAPGFGASYNLVPVFEGTAGARLTWLGDLVSLADTTTSYVGGSNPSFDTRITGTSVWLEFTDPDTDVLKSPIVDDQFNRFYFASPTQMPEYNTYDRIVAGQNPWLLGVPPPGCAVTLSVAGGGNNLTLGNYTQSGGQVPILANTIVLVAFTTPGDTQIQDVQFRLNGVGDPGDETTKWAAVIYNDSNGSPGSLLNTGEIVQGVSNSVPNQSSFLNPTNLIGNTQYWLGFIIDTSHTLEGGPTGGGFGTASFPAPFSNGPPGTAPQNLPATGFGINMWGDFITSDVIESRAYAYTWVSAYGEEGPPSPPTLLDGWSNGTWTLGLWQPPADDLGVVRNLKNVNIYRTVPGQGGATVFFFVATVPIGTTTYVDSAADNVIALNNQLASTTWFPPPANLQGFTVMQNGMVAGFIGNEIWFCEPYQTHAWPPANVLTVDYPVVGMGVTNGTLVVCTDANPFIISGQTPGQMTQQKCALPNPCLSRGSIMNGDGAVSYMSQNGLIQVTPAGVATNTTDLWFTRENWQQLTPQKYARAIFMASCYYCLGSVSPPTVAVPDTSVAQTGFTVELDQDNTSFTIWPQPGGHRLGFNQLTSPTGFNVQNVMTDPWTGVGLVISNGAVYYFDFMDPAPSILPFTWKSKIYQQNTKRSYEAMRVFFTVPSTTPAQGQYRNQAKANDPSWQTLPANAYGYLKTYVDVDQTGNMVLIDCRELRYSGELLRIVDGFKAEQWQWQIDARVVISNVQIATSVKELGNV